MTKIRCGNRENDKYLDGNQDLTTRREAGLTKIWARDAGFFRLLVGIWEVVTTQINVLAAKTLVSPFNSESKLESVPG